MPPRLFLKSAEIRIMKELEVVIDILCMKTTAIILSQIVFEESEFLRSTQILICEYSRKELKNVRGTYRRRSKKTLLIIVFENNCQ